MMSNTLYFPNLNIQIDLNPILVRFTDTWAIHWYGVIVTLAFVAGCFYAYKSSKRFGLIPDNVLDVLFGGVIGGILGARIYYVIFSFDTYKDNLWSVFHVWKGGLAIYGGIIGGILAGMLVCRYKKMKMLPMLDLAAGGFLLGQAIGRWGNFVNMEAFGTNTTLPWGMISDKITAYLMYKQESLAAMGVAIDPTKPVHPTFFYESIWCLIGFLLIHFYSKKRRFDGELILFYIAWYGFGRFWIEGLRTDSLMLGNMRVSQVLAALCVISALAIIIYVRVKIQKTNDPNYLKLYADSVGENAGSTANVFGTANKDKFIKIPVGKRIKRNDRNKAVKNRIKQGKKIR